MSDTMSLIADLLSKAQTTDNEHERDTFMRAAQAKATRAGIDLAKAQRAVDNRGKRETPVRESVWFGHEVTNNVALPILNTYVSLFSAIADANDMRILIHGGSTGVVAIGMPSDIDLVKALFTYLLHQMVVESEHHLKYGQRDTVETRDRWGYRTGQFRKVDARTERKSFCEAFAATVGRRLREARREAIAAAEAEDKANEIDPARYGVDSPAVPDSSAGQELTRTALVLREKKVEVDEFYREQVKGIRGSWKGNSRSRSASASGSAAGRSAGQRASIAAHTAIGA